MSQVEEKSSRNIQRGLIRPLLAGALMLSTLLVQGCSMIYKTTGDVLVNYSEDEMVPYLMGTSDTAMACANGEALTPLLMSFGAVGSHPEKLGVLVNVVAGSCAEEKAVEAELRHLRALDQGNVSAAQDARIQHKRFAALAAEREYKSYQLVTEVYGEANNGRCPRLRSEFDQLVWMVGQLGGVQALLNDSTAQGEVGVPRNIAAKAERGVACLDNEEWWGVPNAIRAALWNTLPIGPDDADPWEMLDKSVEMGFENGVRLPSALYVIAAQGVDDQQKVRAGIREFAEREVDVNPEYKMLDAIARAQITAISDQLWTEATGKRTPMGGLGTFWDDDSGSSDDSDIEGLL